MFSKRRVKSSLNEVMTACFFYFLGTLATQLSLSNHYVWALSPAGEILCRYGVTEDNVTGDYWKKMPGNFTYISGILHKINSFQIGLVTTPVDTKLCKL